MMKVSKRLFSLLLIGAFMFSLFGFKEFNSVKTLEVSASDDSDRCEGQGAAAEVLIGQENEVKGIGDQAPNLANGAVAAPIVTSENESTEADGKAPLEIGIRTGVAQKVEPQATETLGTVELSGSKLTADESLTREEFAAILKTVDTNAGANERQGANASFTDVNNSGWATVTMGGMDREEAVDPEGVAPQIVETTGKAVDPEGVAPQIVETTGKAVVPGVVAPSWTTEAKGKKVNGMVVNFDTLTTKSGGVQTAKGTFAVVNPVTYYKNELQTAAASDTAISSGFPLAAGKGNEVQALKETAIVKLPVVNTPEDTINRKKLLDENAVGPYIVRAYAAARIEEKEDLVAGGTALNSRKWLLAVADEPQNDVHLKD